MRAAPLRVLRNMDRETFPDFLMGEHDCILRSLLHNAGVPDPARPYLLLQSCSPIKKSGKGGWGIFLKPSSRGALIS